MPRRAAISWMGTTRRGGWRARSSIALRAYSPLAEIRIGRSALALPSPLQLARDVPRKVRDHDVRAGPPDARERLHHGALLVEPAEPPCCPDHRVLAGHRIGGQRHAELRLGPGD